MIRRILSICTVLMLFAASALVALPVVAADGDPCEGVGNLPRTRTPTNTSLNSRPYIALHIADFPKECSVDSFAMSIDGYLVDASKRWAKGGLEILFPHWDSDVSPGQHKVQVRILHDDRVVVWDVWSFGYLVPGHNSPLHHKQSPIGSWSSVRLPPAAGHEVEVGTGRTVEYHVTLNAYALYWVRPQEEIVSVGIRHETWGYAIGPHGEHELFAHEVEIIRQIRGPCMQTYCAEWTDPLLP